VVLKGAEPVTAMFPKTGAAERGATAKLDVLASYITLSSVVYYASVIALLHVLRTDFDPGYRYLSEYARGPYGALMTSTFFVLSAGSLARNSSGTSADFAGQMFRDRLPYGG
jgi:hypothetical protein